MGYGLWVMGYGLWVMGYGLWVMGYGLCLPKSLEVPLAVSSTISRCEANFLIHNQGKKNEKTYGDLSGFGDYSSQSDI